VPLLSRTAPLATARRFDAASWHRIAANVALIQSKTRAEKAAKSLSCVVPVGIVPIIAIGEAEGRRASGHGLLTRLRLVIALVPIPLRGPGIPVAVSVGLALLRILRLLLACVHLRALRHENAVIVLRVLEIVLLHHAIAGRTRIARELEIFLVHMGSGAANLDVRPRGIKCPVVIVVMIVVVLRPTAASA